MEEPLPLTPPVKQRAKRTRSKKGATKFVRKKQRTVPYRDQRKLSASSPPPAPTTTVGLEDLPNEIVCLIFGELRQLDYYKYRQLRLSPCFAHIVDARFYVFVYDGGGRGIYKPPKHGTVARFHDRSEFVQHIEDLSYQYKVKYDEMTIYLDFRSDNDIFSHFQVCQDITKVCLHKGISLSILVNADREFKMIATVYPKKKKGMIQIIEVLKPDTDACYRITRQLREQQDYYLYAFSQSMVVITNTPQAAVDLFSLKNVYWKSSIEKLKDLVLVHSNGVLLKKILILDTLMNLTTLDLRTRDVNRSALLNLDSLNLPNLTHFNTWGSVTVKFVNNKFPKLIQLYIEDIDTLTDFRTRNGTTEYKLEFKGNHMPNLITLALSTHRLQAFEWDATDHIPTLKNFRLELRELNPLGNMIYLIETLKKTKNLSLMTKKELFDSEILMTYLDQLDCTNALESLSINLNGAAPKHWLTALQEKTFPSLTTLRLYNLNIQTELPSLSAPQLRNLIIMGSYEHPKTIVIGDYPHLEHIYTRKHLAESLKSDQYEYCVSSPRPTGPPIDAQTISLTPDVRMFPESLHFWSLNYNAGSKDRHFLVYDVKDCDAGVIKLAYHQRFEQVEMLKEDEGWYIKRQKKRPPANDRVYSGRLN